MASQNLQFKWQIKNHSNFAFFSIDGAVISSCFHTGFFLVKNLRPLADKLLTSTDTVAAAQSDYDTYVEDFCNTYTEVLPMRTEFVKAIYEIEDKESFGTTCIN